MINNNSDIRKVFDIVMDLCDNEGITFSYEKKKYCNYGGILKFIAHDSNASTIFNLLDKLRKFVDIKDLGVSINKEKNETYFSLYMDMDGE